MHECLYTPFMDVQYPYTERNISQTDKYLVSLSSKMYVIEDKMTKY